MILQGKDIEEQAKANAEKMRRGQWPDPAPAYVEAQKRIEQVFQPAPKKD